MSRFSENECILSFTEDLQDCALLSHSAMVYVASHNFCSVYCNLSMSMLFKGKRHCTVHGRKNIWSGMCLVARKYIYENIITPWNV